MWGTSLSATDADPSQKSQTQQVPGRSRVACEYCKRHGVMCAESPCLGFQFDDKHCMLDEDRHENDAPCEVCDREWPTNNTSDSDELLPSPLTSYLPANDLPVLTARISQDRVGFDNILTLQSSMLWEETLSSFKSLSMQRSIDQFKVLFTKRNPDAKGFPGTMGNIRGIDAHPEQSLRDDLSYFSSDFTPAEMCHNPDTGCSSMPVSLEIPKSGGSLSALASIQRRLAWIMALISAGKIYSALEETGQLIRQAKISGLHLKPQRDVVIDSDDEARTSIWRQIIDVDCTLSIATGFAPDTSHNSVSAFPRPKKLPSSLGAEVKRANFNLVDIATLRRDVWSNPSILSHVEDLERNIDFLITGRNRYSTPSIHESTDSEVSLQLYTDISTVILRTHAYILCICCNAQQPSRRGKGNYEQVYNGILKSARVVLQEFFLIRQASQAALSQDWMSCYYAYTAAIVLGIARFESNKNLSVKKSDYECIDKARLIFKSLMQANPGSHLFRLAATRLLHVLMGDEHSGLRNLEAVSSTKDKAENESAYTDLPGCELSVNLFDELSTSSQTLIATDEKSASDSNWNTAEFDQTWTSSSMSPRKRAMPSPIRALRKRRKRTLDHNSSRRSSVPIAPLCRRPEATLGSQSFPNTPIINGNGSTSLPQRLGTASTDATQHSTMIPSLVQHRHAESTHANVSKVLITLPDIKTEKELPQPCPTPKAMGVKKVHWTRRPKKQVGNDEGFVHITVSDWAFPNNPEEPKVRDYASIPDLDETRQPSSEQLSVSQPERQIFRSSALQRHPASFTEIKTPEDFERERKSSKSFRPRIQGQFEQIAVQHDPVRPPIAMPDVLAIHHATILTLNQTPNPERVIIHTPQMINPDRDSFTMTQPSIHAPLLVTTDIAPQASFPQGAGAVATPFDSMASLVADVYANPLLNIYAPVNAAPDYTSNQFYPMNTAQAYAMWPTTWPTEEDITAAGAMPNIGAGVYGVRHDGHHEALDEQVAFNAVGQGTCGAAETEYWWI